MNDNFSWVLVGHLLDPFEVVFHPYVNQSNEQNEQKDQNFRKRVKARALANPIQVHGRDRIDKRDFHLEHHEDQGDQVEADVEVNPRASGRWLATFIRSQLARVRVVGREQLLQPKHRGHEANPDDRQRQWHPEMQIHKKVTGTSINLTRSHCQEEWLFEDMSMLKLSFFANSLYAQANRVRNGGYLTAARRASIAGPSIHAPSPSGHASIEMSFRVLCSS